MWNIVKILKEVFFMVKVRLFYFRVVCFVFDIYIFRYCFGFEGDEEVEFIKGGTKVVFIVKVASLLVKL